VWPEAATLVWPDEEQAWTETVRQTARDADIDVVAAYVMPTSAKPFAYRNEYRIVLSDGAVFPPYAKHHPVPGEPAIRGVGPAPVALREWGRLSGVICYDDDFPAMGVPTADLLAVPASDWRGIDPVHAQMAAVRAIERGQSMLRSTRWGLSLGVDAYGRARAWHSAFERGSDLTFVDLPTTHIWTLYGFWGDTPLAIALAALVVAMWRRRS
jgi:apolipoprotein N-acyltransferase